MKRLTLFLLVMFTALVGGCSSATAPKPVTPPPGIDPSLLVINHSAGSVWAIFVSDQTGILATDTVRIAPFATVCTRWTQTFDSLYTQVEDTLPNTTGSWGSVTAPWIHF